MTRCGSGRTAAGRTSAATGPPRRRTSPTRTSRTSGRPERIAEAEENLPDLPAVAEAGNTATGSGGTTQVWLPDGKVKKQPATQVKATYHKNAAPVGKLFFTTPQGSSVCSAAVVKDPAHPGKSNLVWTAGHCVHAGKGGGWYRNIAFVPSFNNTGKLNIAPGVPGLPRHQRLPLRPLLGRLGHHLRPLDQGRRREQGTVAAAYDYAVLHVKPEKGAKSLEERSVRPCRCGSTPPPPTRSRT